MDQNGDIWPFLDATGQVRLLLADEDDADAAHVAAVSLPEDALEHEEPFFADRITIEHNGVIRLSPEAVQGPGGISGHEDAVAQLLELIAHDILQPRVRLDDEYRAHRWPRLMV